MRNIVNIVQVTSAHFQRTQTFSTSSRFIVSDLLLPGLTSSSWWYSNSLRDHQIVCVCALPIRALNMYPNGLYNPNSPDSRIPSNHQHHTLLKWLSASHSSSSRRTLNNWKFTQSICGAALDFNAIISRTEKQPHIAHTIWTLQTYTYIHAWEPWVVVFAAKYSKRIGRLFAIQSVWLCGYAGDCLAPQRPFGPPINII